MGLRAGDRAPHESVRSSQDDHLQPGFLFCFDGRHHRLGSDFRNDESAQNLKMEQGEKSAKVVNRHAAEWVAANRSQFDKWLSEARAVAKMASKSN